MATALSTDQINDALTQLPGWSFEDSSDGSSAIGKQFKFKDFKEALSFIVRLGLHAEEQAHHPDLHNVYNTVTIKLNTHDAGGKVTEKDIALAQAIESFNWVD